MKDKFFRYVLILLLFSLIAATPLFAAAPKTAYISLDPASLKESASSFSKDVGTVEYATKVRVLEEKKSWSRIELFDNPGITGWVPSSALSAKKLKAKGSGATADADEIALAGKGFTSTIEAVYAEEYAVDYSAVDFAELQTPSPEAVLEFIREGGLNGGEE